MSALVKLAVALAALVLGRMMYRRATRAHLIPGYIALITGGGSGIGLELALIFARAGCRVVIVGRNEATLKEAVGSCKQAGASAADYIVADLSTQAGVQAVAKTLRGLPGVDMKHFKYLVLNAGAGAIAPFSPDARFAKIVDDMMKINYYSNVWLLQELLPTLEANHSAEAPSRLLVMSSLAGILPSILRSAYTGSKHAIQGFMNAMRGETSVPITLCCPGYVDTDFHQRVLTADGKPLPGHQRRGVSPAACAQACVDGALNGDAEVVMTLAGKLGYTLRPWLTSIVDAMAKRKSLKSIEVKDSGKKA